MRENRQQALAWIGLSEGGYVNHPADPGGATDRGITQATFDAWNRRNGQPLRPVKGIAKETAEAILVAQYFAPVRFDELPSGLDYAVVDFAVNSGPGRAMRTLQEVAGARVDGMPGPETMAAICRHAPAALIGRYCTARMGFLRGLPTFSTFGKGWTRRVMGDAAGEPGVMGRALSLAGAPAAGAAAGGPAPLPTLFARLLAALTRLFH